MDIKKINEELNTILNEISYNTAKDINRIRKNNVDTAEKNYKVAKDRLDNTPQGTYSVDPQTKNREQAEKDFKQARDFLKLARNDYAKNQKLFKFKHDQYYQQANEKAAKFWELKDEYVDKITDILEADGWDLVRSEVIYGFDVEYTYEKYYDFVNDNIYCTFNSDGPGGFYSIGFSVGSPKNEDWDECCLSNYIELPKHPVYPEKMDHISLDPRYDGPTAENEWEQYVDFVKNMVKLLNSSPKVIK